MPKCESCELLICYCISPAQTPHTASVTHPNHSSLDFTRDTMSTDDILSEHSCAQPVLCVVRLLNHLIFGLERLNHNERSKDFLPRGLHVVLGIGKDSRVDKVALLVRNLATQDQSGSLGFGRLDIAQDLFLLRLADLRTVSHVTVELTTDSSVLLRVLLELLEELLVYRVLDVDSRRRRADLPRHCLELPSACDQHA